MRNRRTERIGPVEADQLVTGDPGTEHANLRHLLDAARAPATAQELRGEEAAVAAFVAHRKRAARAARRNRTPQVRTAAVPVTAALALLAFGGTAVAARTGNLPQDAQQHAHRLFSALGVPAPRTGTATPAPSHPSPTPRPSITALGWCDAWPHGPLSSEDRRRLVAAAGSEKKVAHYCDELRKSASATPGRAPATPPGQTKGEGKGKGKGKEEGKGKTPGATPSKAHGHGQSPAAVTKSQRP